MSKLSLSLESEKATFRPGDHVRGLVEWTLDHAPPDGSLVLRWRTSGHGNTDEHTVRSSPLSTLRAPRPAAGASASPYRQSAVAEQTRPLEAVDSRVFRFDAPQGPYSFAGRLVSLTWELRVELAGYTARQEIIISPTREIYVLDDTVLL